MNPKPILTTEQESLFARLKQQLRDVIEITGELSEVTTDPGDSELLFDVADNAARSLRELEKWFGVDVDDDGEQEYVITIDGETHDVTAASREDAIEQAEALIRSIEWGNGKQTTWVDYRISDGDELDETLTVTIDPVEPLCIEGEHDWQRPYDIVGGLPANPGVFGKAGGVIIHEVCTHCRYEKVTDTWARRPDTGECGMTSVEYRMPDE